MRVIGGVFLPASANPIFKRYHVLKVHDIAKLQILFIMQKRFFNELPAAVGEIFEVPLDTPYLTRQTYDFQVLFSTRNYRLFTIACQGPRLWNEIISTNFVRNEVPQSKLSLKKFLKTYFLESYW